MPRFPRQARKTFGLDLRALAVGGLIAAMTVCAFDYFSSRSTARPATPDTVDTLTPLAKKKISKDLRAELLTRSPFAATGRIVDTSAKTPEKIADFTLETQGSSAGTLHLVMPDGQSFAVAPDGKVVATTKPGFPFYGVNPLGIPHDVARTFGTFRTVIADFSRK
jgi:hypothetical protein